MDRIRLTLPTKPEYVSLARLTIASVANNMGFSIGDVEDLKVAVSEACTNALNHSMNPDSTYDLIYIVEENKKLSFTVTDRGVGFEPETVVEPDLNGKKVNGFGLFIIKSLMDRVDIVSEKGAGTSITMIKNLSTANEI
ncbi:ATP-binding protein [Acetobacterium tundrae]|uniref:Histidine kinase n=1 Tax=Acetobacterium tundrae TaxID=132932 RepID=A0ABR6WLQ6_9FIRM|nr:ATP-binding protein [Acetobacterium tundrae]MBC3797196.1 histidine kinase [Acetobacterium tundrae]